MLEDQIYNYLKKDDKLATEEEIYRAFSSHSKSLVKSALDRLCRQNKVYSIDTYVGKMYGVDDSEPNEVYSVNFSTGEGEGALLKALGIFDNYKSIFDQAIKSLPKKSFGIKNPNDKKYKKETYDQDTIMEWLNVVIANREYINTIKAGAIKQLAANIQSQNYQFGIRGVLETLGKIELEAAAKEREKLYKKTEEVWELIKERTEDRQLLESVSKVLSDIVSHEVEDMTVNGGELYYSVPVPNIKHYQKAFKLSKAKASVKKTAETAKLTPEEKKYQQADKLFKKAKTISDFEKVKNLVDQNADHKESKKLIDKCDKEIDRIKKEKEEKLALVKEKYAKAKARNEFEEIITLIGKDCEDEAYAEITKNAKEQIELIRQKEIEAAKEQYYKDKTAWDKMSESIKKKRDVEIISALQKKKANMISTIEKTYQETCKECDNALQSLHDELKIAEQELGSLGILQFSRKRELKARIEKLNTSLQETNHKKEKARIVHDDDLKQVDKKLADQKTAIQNKVFKKYPIPEAPTEPEALLSKATQ